jgi:sulfonate transport system substrate-binding protein
MGINSNVSRCGRPRLGHLLRSSITALGVIGALALLTEAGCSHPGQPGSTRSVDGSKVVRIGYQKLGGANIVRLQGTLDREMAAKGVAVEWISFPAGPELMQAMGTGNVDIGGGGDTVPIFAQAAGVSFVYISNTPVVKPWGIAVLVHDKSPLRNVADLKGRRIALVKGTGSHFFFVQALERAHIEYSDIQPVYLEPSDAFAAFASGKIDAWVAWDPYITLARQKLQARILVDQSGIPSNGGFILASRKFALEHPEWIAPVLDKFLNAGRWAEKHPNEAVDLLSPTAGLDRRTLLTLVQNGAGLHYNAIDEKIISLQQREADEFHKLGILRKKIDIHRAMLTPEEYAKIKLPG